MIYALSLIFISSTILLFWPYIIYPILIKNIKTKKLNVIGKSSGRVSLLFCAFNEERSIVEKLSNLKELKNRYPDIEILAYDDGSTDRTREIISSQPGLVRLINGAGRCGKAHGMKILAKESTGDILVFTDANVILDIMAVDNLLKYYSDSDVGGVCGSLKYLGASETSTAAVGGIYWRLEEFLKKEEARTGNVMGADGSIFSIRKSLYPEFPDTVLDDLTVSMNVVFMGKRLIKAEDVIAYERLVTKSSEEFQRKVRIAARAFHTHTYLKPNLKKMRVVDKFKYISRKFIRWFGGLFLILSITSFLGLSYLMSPTLSLILGGSLTVLIFTMKTSNKRSLNSIFEIILALFATLLGVLRAMKGVTYSVWNPAKSR